MVAVEVAVVVMAHGCIGGARGHALLNRVFVTCSVVFSGSKNTVCAKQLIVLHFIRSKKIAINPETLINRKDSLS